MLIKLDKKNVRFVKKAEYGVPISQQVKPSSHGSLGIPRSMHKYIKRENLSSGQHKYIYDDAKGSKAPPDKDMKAMVEEFRTIMQSDKDWKKFADYFDDSDLNNISNAMNVRGDEITPENFMLELNNAKSALGSRVNEFLPRSVIVKEYKKLFEIAGNRPSEYNKKIEEGMTKKQLTEEQEMSMDFNNLMGMGFNEEQINEFRRNPKKIKDAIEKLKKLMTIKGKE